MGAGLDQRQNDAVQRHKVADRPRIADDDVQRRVPFRVHGVDVEAALENREGKLRKIATLIYVRDRHFFVSLFTATSIWNSF